MLTFEQSLEVLLEAADMLQKTGTVNLHDAATLHTAVEIVKANIAARKKIAEKKDKDAAAPAAEEPKADAEVTAEEPKAEEIPA